MITLKQAAIMYKPGIINLNKNKQAIVDKDIYFGLLKHKWFFDKKGKTGYAATTRNGKILYMHRLILGEPENKIIDHIDHNGLNNQNSNLRICTHSENKANALVYRNNTSGYKGVCWDKNRNKWMAKIKYMGRLIYIGRFDSKEKAAEMYLKKAKELFGEFAFQESLLQGGKS